MNLKKLSVLIVLLALLGVYWMNKKNVDSAIGKFALSVRSESHMIGVHGDLKRVVRRAIELTPFDFGITSGKRTAESQYLVQ